MDNSTGDAKVAKKQIIIGVTSYVAPGQVPPAWSLCTYTNLAISIYI